MSFKDTKVDDTDIILAQDWNDLVDYTEAISSQTWPLSVSYDSHSGNKDIHFPSSQLTSWINGLYHPSAQGDFPYISTQSLSSNTILSTTVDIVDKIRSKLQPDATFIDLNTNDVDIYTNSYSMIKFDGGITPHTVIGNINGDTEGDNHRVDFKWIQNASGGPTMFHINSKSGNIAVGKDVDDSGYTFDINGSLYANNISSQSISSSSIKGNLLNISTGFAQVSSLSEIPHGLSSIPSYVNVTPSGNSINFGVSCKVDATNITVDLTIHGKRDVYWVAHL